jgi:hypothetical protein
MRLIALLLWFVAIIVVLPGCSSGPTGPSVKGQVLLDGKPVAGARVVFHGKGGATTVTDNDGKFFLNGSTYKNVQPGKYLVMIAKYVDKKTGKAPDPEDVDNLLAAGKLKSELPEHYGAMEENPLIAEIKEGANELQPFQLKTK